MANRKIVINRIGLVGAALFVSLLAFSHPQDDPLARIRSLWADVQERIALAVKEAEGGSPPGFYASEVVINRHNGSWRASGTYFKKTVFWYTDHPEFAGEEPGGPASVLTKVEIQEIVAAQTFYREFLFDKGKLVFAFVQSPEGSGTPAEIRFYFDNGVLFRTMEGQKVIEARPEVKAILAEARELQALFLDTF